MSESRITNHESRTKGKSKVISPKGVPAHIGIILDGNRRWAKKRGLPTLLGHRQGAKNVKSVALAAKAEGVRFLTFYVFSTENWRRENAEVSYLMDIFRELFRKEIEELHKENIRVLVSGRREPLPKDILDLADEAVKKTSKNTGGTLVFALNYGGRGEIVDAVKSIVDNQVASKDVTETTISDSLYQPDVPEPAMIIRTGGDKRLSNFLLWQGAYAELYFTDVKWPVFGATHLRQAIMDYKERKRNFGK